MCEYLLAELEQPVGTAVGERGQAGDSDKRNNGSQEYAAKYHTESYFTRLFVRDFPKYPVHLYALSYAESEALRSAAPAFWLKHMKEAADAYSLCTYIYSGKFERNLWVQPISPLQRIFLDKGYAPPAMEQAWGAFAWALSVMRSRMWKDRLVPVGTYFNHHNNASQPNVINRLSEQVGVVLVTAGAHIAANAEVFDNYDKGAGYGNDRHTDTSSSSHGVNTPSRLCNTDLFMKYGFVEDVPQRHCLLLRVAVGMGSVAATTAATADVGANAAIAEVTHVELRYHSGEGEEGSSDMTLEAHVQNTLSKLFEVFRRHLQVSLRRGVGAGVNTHLNRHSAEAEADAEAEAEAVREKCVHWMAHEAVRDALSMHATAIPLDAFDILSKPMLRPYTTTAAASGGGGGGGVGGSASSEVGTETSDRRTWRSRTSVLESIEIIAKGSQIVKQQVLGYLAATKKKAFERNRWSSNERAWAQGHVDLCTARPSASNDHVKDHVHLGQSQEL